MLSHHLITREKLAFDPSLLGVLGVLGSGAALHVGTNALMRYLRNSAWGRNKLETNQITSGYRHGVEGTQVHPLVQKAMTLAAGPESLEAYHLAKEMGEKSKTLDPTARSLALTKLKEHISNTPALQSAPLLRSMPGAIEGINQGQKTWLDKLPSVTHDYKPSMAAKIAPYAATAAVGAAEPHTLIHIGINAARDAASKSKMGTNFMKNQFKKGIGGSKLSPVSSILSDYLISPAALDSRRLGQALLQAHPKNVSGAQSLLRMFKK